VASRTGGQGIPKRLRLTKLDTRSVVNYNQLELPNIISNPSACRKIEMYT
jgi:hypothetical protein